MTSAESWTSGVPGKKLEGTQSGGFGALDAARTLSIVHQTLRRQRLYRGNNNRHIGTNEELGEQLIEHYCHVEVDSCGLVETPQVSDRQLDARLQQFASATRIHSNRGRKKADSWLIIIRYIIFCSWIRTVGPQRSSKKVKEKN